MANILVVDDDPDFAEAIGCVLRAAGFQVETASHFEPALQVLDRVGHIDLLVTDLVMPGGVNGIALARMAHLRQPRMAVIYLTGFDIPLGVEGETFGPILRKPVDGDVLIRRVKETLAAPRTGPSK